MSKKCPPSTVYQLANALADGRTKIRLARLWLTIRLLDEPELATIIIEEGRQKGFNARLLRRAGKGLVTHKKERWGWEWHLLPRLETQGLDEYREAIVKRLLELSE